MDKLYIIIPAYNEEANVVNVIKDWYPIVEQIGNGSKLIMIDDGSKDSTFEIMKDMAKSLPAFEPITKPNSGHGATLLYGYRYAMKAGADYIFQTDSDGQTIPFEFWPFWNIRNNYDMIIGNRNKRQDGLSRIFVTKILKLVLRISFGVTLADANTPFRLMKTSVLKEHINLIPDNFNLSNVMIAVIYAKKNLSVKYLPVTFRKRQGGVNSINMKRIIKIGKQAWSDFRRINQSLN